jgi:predicted transcriptional regulator
LIALIQEQYPKSRTVRPEGALTTHEMVEQTGKSLYQIQKLIRRLMAEGKVQSAHVSRPGGYDVVYWLTETTAQSADAVG